jgi:uncharacterized protein involved in high-affinity Fe2+ transport
MLDERRASMVRPLRSATDARRRRALALDPTRMRIPFPVRPAVRAVALALSLGAAGCISRSPNLETGMRLTEAGRGTAPSMSPFASSDEATAQQLERARDQGNVVRDEVEWVRAHDAAASAEMTAGEYRIAYIVTAPAGYYDSTNAWHEPSGTAHVAAVVRDAADGREVPGLTVTATITPSGGGAAHVALPYGWQAVLNRYGENVSLPDGPFTLRLDVAPPSYWRHDPTNGDRFADTVTAEFTNVSVDRAALARVGAVAGDTALDSARVSLSRREGAALERPLLEMFSSVAVNGEQTRAGDYLVVVAVERAEGYWMPMGKDIAYNIVESQSAAHNGHVEVGVRDARTGRFLPGLNLTATVLDGDRTIGTKHEPFMWHPWIHHYGENWRIPRTGRYSVRVHADPPPFRRYGRSATFFTAPVDLRVDGLRFVTGQK